MVANHDILTPCWPWLIKLTSTFEHITHQENVNSFTYRSLFCRHLFSDWVSCDNFQTTCWSSQEINIQGEAYIHINSTSIIFLWFSLCFRCCQKQNFWRKFQAIQITEQRKTFYRQRIPESNCVRKETVDIDILVTFRNGGRKIMQSIRITSRPPSRKSMWNSWASSEEHLPK